MSIHFNTKNAVRQRMAVREALRLQGMTRLARQGMPQWAREIVLAVSRETGVCVSEIAGTLRFRNIVAARNEAIYRVKERKPTLSGPQIGKWFDRDHTSIFHAIANHQKRNGLPKLVGYDLDRVRARNADTSARMRATAMTRIYPQKRAHMGRFLKEAR